MFQAPMLSHDISSWEPLVLFFVAAICIIILAISGCCLINSLIFHGSYRAQRQQQLNEDNANDSSMQINSQGLESSIMDSLPITLFRKDKEPEGTNSECGVCLGEFEEGEWLKHLPNCSHGFHVACIDTWFQRHSNCPLCRSSVCDDFVFPHERSVSMYPMLETLRRENAFQERPANYQILHSAVLHNPITMR